MKRRKIGVMVECFRLGVKGGIEKAAALGADGFQVWVTEGETAPENFSAIQRREFRKYVAETKLVISALCADFGQGFLEQIPNRGIKVNYDPANLCMGGFDQIGGVEALTGYIVHTHAKDGVRGQYKEVPLGEGNVDFPRYLAALDRIGYDGFLTIEREVGENPVGDIEKAVKFLRGL